MRAGEFLKEEDLKVQGDTQDFIKRAIKRVEQETGLTVEKVTRVQERLLSQEPILLNDFPVRKVTVEGRELSVEEVNEELGIVTLKMEGTSAGKLTYETGFEDGELPVVLQVLLLKAARDEAGLEEHPEDIQELLKVVKVERNRAQEERESFAASGAL